MRIRETFVLSKCLWELFVIVRGRSVLALVYRGGFGSAIVYGSIGYLAGTEGRVAGSKFLR